MTTDQILSLSPQLGDFLDEFADCFGRSEPRQHLAHYIRGQLSDLPRKSVEPIALAADVRPRTLQEFLSTDVWDHELLRRRVHEIVVRDHADPKAIGIIDESGHPKHGPGTAGVQRQYCGNTGKIDNCVMTVHLSYASHDVAFRTMLDSTLYLPQSWHDDRDRCRAAGIPDAVVYRSKYVIALEQLDRAQAHGVAFRWLTFDEWYTQKPAFRAAVEQRGYRYVAEIPRNLLGWLTPSGNTPRWQARPADHLCRHSRPMQRQDGVRFHIKDTEKGPMVWEVKAAHSFWLPQEGKPVGPYWLIFACNVLHPEEEKYFISNASPDTPLEELLHVAFARWPIERCLEDEKTELGLSHFEVRKYAALQRHLFITQVSHLFLARQNARLRGEKPGDHALPGPHGGPRLDRRPDPAPSAAPPTVAARRHDSRLHAKTQPPSPKKPL
jgi:SRSO17 transposase